jgi:hypothetical protein
MLSREEGGMKRIAVVVFVAVFLLGLMVIPAIAQEKCPICGMNLAGNENTAFEVEKASGETVVYCCPHCGLWVMAKEGDTVKSAKARDLISGEWVDAKKAVYLFNSKAVPACAPSWIAFEKKKEAEQFKKGFGGTIYSYDAAIKKRAAMPEEMETKGTK